MTLGLGLAPAERDEHREREQLAGPDVDAGAGVVVAEAVRRQVAAGMCISSSARGGIHLIDALVADDLLLDGQALLRRGSRASSWTALRAAAATPRSANTSLVAWMKSNALAMPT